MLINYVYFPYLFESNTVQRVSPIINSQRQSNLEKSEYTHDIVEEMNKKKKIYRELDKTQTNILKNCLKEINHSKASDLESFEKQEPAEILKRFYIAARKSDGDLYKLTAFRAIKYGLARFFEEKKNLDIVNDVELKKANIIYGRMEERLRSVVKVKWTIMKKLNLRIYLSSVKAFILRLRMD